MSGFSEVLTVGSFTEGDRRVVVLRGELDIATAPLAADALGEPVDVVDVSGLEFMDSSGVKVLLRACEAHTGPLVVRGVRPAVRRILELTGVADLLVFEDAAPHRVGSPDSR